MYHDSPWCLENSLPFLGTKNNSYCIYNLHFRDKFIDLFNEDICRALTARVECWSAETSRLLSEEICNNNLNILFSICFTNKPTSSGIDTKGRQTNTLHDRIDTKVMQGDLDQQFRHLLVIFENLEATLKTETTFSNLNFLGTTVIVSKACKEVKMGDSLQ